MFTFRNLAAVGLFLFGTTFLWMTAAFAGKTPPPQGTAWTIENAMALALVVGFSATAWAVYKDLSWWEPVATVSAIVGLVAIVPYALALAQAHIGLADLGIQINLVLHGVGSAVVLGLVAIPAMHEWFASHLA